MSDALNTDTFQIVGFDEGGKKSGQMAFIGWYAISRGAERSRYEARIVWTTSTRFGMRASLVRSSATRSHRKNGERNTATLIGYGRKIIYGFCSSDVRLVGWPSRGELYTILDAPYLSRNPAHSTGSRIVSNSLMQRRPSVLISGLHVGPDA